MSVARFHFRTATAVGRHLAVTAETLETRLQSLVVGLRCESDGDLNSRWIAEGFINLAARLYPVIRIDARSQFRNDLAALAHRINPDIQITGDDAVPSVGVTTETATRPGELFLGASGWCCVVGTNPQFTGIGPPNPFAAGAAVGIGAALVFNRAFELEDLPGHRLVSLLDYSDSPNGSADALDPNLEGKILLAGLGAVGNGALWCLSRLEKLKCQLVLADPERVELSNLQRYVLALDNDEGKQKTKIAKRYLLPTGAAIDEAQRPIENISFESFDAVLVTVDNIRARRFAQAILPRIVINGWTSASGLGASWHEFANGSACLACLYQPTGVAPSQTELAAAALGLPPDRAALLWVSGTPISAADLELIAKRIGVTASRLSQWNNKKIQSIYSDVICGSAVVDVTRLGNPEAVPLAHQSFLAGVFAVTELIKRTNRGLSTMVNPEPLIAWHNVLKSPPHTWVQPRSPVPGCICSDISYVSQFERRWRPQSPKLSV